MNFKIAASALVLACAFATLPGCAADAPQDEGDAEEAGASQDEMTAAARRLVGAFVGKGTARPSFDGLVFNRDGSFFGDLDTGLRCFRAPCPSGAHVEGRYTATTNYLRLTAKAGTADNRELLAYYGRYKYTLAGQHLALSRPGSGIAWSDTLDKELSYCAQPSDCEKQDLNHIMCVGSWTCGDSAAKACAFKCGIAGNNIWPATATKLVAESASGGFGPRPPAGSACAPGRQRYALDRATRAMTFETCESAGVNPVDGTRMPYQLKTGTTKITVAELAAINTAMGGVTLTTQEICGADKPFEHLEVTTPAGVRIFDDGFYSCKGGAHTYIDGIGAVFTAMRAAK